MSGRRDSTGPSLLPAVAVSLLLGTAASAQLCPPPACSGTVLCDHLNRITDYNSQSVSAIVGPNTPAGNVAGDAEWKILGCEHAMTRASGSVRLAGWTVTTLVQPLNNPATGFSFFEIPSFEVRPVTLNAAGQRVPDLSAPPLFAADPGPIKLTYGLYGMQVLASPLSPWGAPGCGPSPGLPTLPAQDLAFLVGYTPGESVSPPPGFGYFQSVLSVQEWNFLLNLGSNGQPNSYSGRIDAATSPPTILVRPPNEELMLSIAFYEPVLQAFKAGPSFFPTLAPGPGARNLLPFENLVFWSLDWASGEGVAQGKSRQAVVLLGDASSGAPVCPGGALLPGSAILPYSTGALSLYPTGTTLATLGWTALAGTQCHVWSGSCTIAGDPTLDSTMHAETPPIPIPPGIPSGSRIYAAAFYLQSAPGALPVFVDGSNTVEIVFF